MSSFKTEWSPRSYRNEYNIVEKKDWSDKDCNNSNSMQFSIDRHHQRFHTASQNTIGEQDHWKTYIGS